MSMLEDLRFVQGAVRRNVISPELEHYRIKGGRVTGFNGHMALSSPIALDFEAYPRAAFFFKALAACHDAVSLHMTESLRLAIRSGSFKAFVPCLDGFEFDVSPQGEMFPCPADFVDDMRQLLPFISEDASRPWSMGLLVADGSYTATNNVLVIQKWSGHALPRFNFPRFALSEVVRIGEQPTAIQANEDSVTFHYDNGRWIRTQLYPDQWPLDKLNGILSAEHEPGPLVDGFAAAVEKLLPFAEEKSSAIYFEREGICTHLAAEDGVHIGLVGLPDGPVFGAKQLELLATVAERIDWEMYPAPCVFYGDRLRGAIVGMNR